MGTRGLLLCGLIVSGCYSAPELANGSVACGGVNGDCPSGYTCGCDGYCQAIKVARSAPGPLPPPVERAVWEKVAGISHRVYPNLVYDPIRDEVILFSGTGSDGVGGDTWAWNGSRWSWRADAGPASRAAAAAAFDHARGELVMFSGDCYYGCTNAETWAWNGIQWRQVAATGPASLEYAAMVDDEARGQLLLFGGSWSSQERDELWSWNGTAWKQLCTSAACMQTRPSARAGHTMVYDRARQRTVLFGGYDLTSTTLGDIWEWDGTQWNEMCTSSACKATAPTPREGHSMYFDSVRNRTVVLGGAVPGYNDEVWEWDGAQWMLSTEPRPPARYDARATFDEARGVGVVFGGDSPTTAYVERDTWERSAIGWSRVDNGSPGAMHDPGLTYDPTRGTVVHYGGNGDNDEHVWEWTTAGRYERNCDVANCDVYGTRRGPLVYDEARGETLQVAQGGALWGWKNGVWSQKCTQAPCNTIVPTGFSAAAAYDRKRAVVVIAIGANELWEWDGASFTPKCTDTTCMANRPTQTPATGSLAYDRAREVVVHYSLSGETWEWSGTAWARRCTASPCQDVTPGGRYSPSLAYQPVRQTVQLFGGGENGLGQRADVWEWNGTAWTKLADGGPLPREQAATVFHEQRGRMVLFAGASEEGVAWLSDTWEFHVRGGTCTTGTQCDSGHCVDGVCCDQSACGTCEACNVGLDAGTCVTLTERDDPDSCSGTSTCGPTGTCARSAGEACAADADCATARCSTDPCNQVCI